MFIKDLKSTLTDTYVKFNQKVKGPSTQNCTIFVSNKYPQYKKECIQILSKYEFTPENEIIGKDYKQAILEHFKDKGKQSGLAMKFVAY